MYKITDSAVQFSIFVIFLFPLILLRIGIPDSFATHFVFLLLSLSFFILVTYKNLIVTENTIVLMFLLIIILCFTLFIGVSRSINFINYWREIRGIYQSILVLLILVNFKIFNPNRINYILYIFTIFQIVVSVLQYLDILWINELTFSPKNSLLLPHGTFDRYNDLGNLFAVLFFYFLFLGKKPYNSKIFLALIVFVILITGNRISFLSFSIAFAVYLFFKHKKLFVFFVISLIFSLVIYNSILLEIGEKYKHYTDGGASNPVTRLMSLFSLTSIESINKTTEIGSSLSTLTLNIEMLYHIDGNFLLGVSEFFKGGYGNIQPMVGNYSDVYFLWWIAEIGLVGFLILIAPYIYFLNQLRRHNKNSFLGAFLMVLVGLITSITDMGIWNAKISFFIFLFIGLDLNKAKYG